jgi:hypothetical protein
MKYQNKISQKSRISLNEINLEIEKKKKVENRINNEVEILF